MRVYELARKLGMENRDLMPELKRLGITVASHSSALDDPTAARVLEQLMPKPKSVSSTDGDKADDGGREAPKREMGKKKAGEALRGRRGQARESAKSVGVKPALVVIEEPPKADKKRILVKRQKVEEVMEPEGGVTPASPGDAFTPVVPTAPATVASAFILESQKAPPPPTMPAAEVVGPASFVQPGPATQPQTLASAAPPVQPAPVVVPGEVRPETKKGVTIGAPAAELTELRDKLKKLKKVGRGREEEDFKFREDAARWQDLRAIPVHRRDERSRHTVTTSVAEITKPRKKIIKLTAGLTVKEFAELVGQRPADIVRKMMEVGHMLTLIQPMNLDAAVLLAEGFGLKAEIAAEKQPEELLDETAAVVEPEGLEPRPPVVTIMGHVDHGKTSLLDAVRKTKVAEQEAGGITQHIGAYTARVQGKQVTFLDTPGHEAFTAMRARGAKITDLVVLVVAADDGVMPQTVEAIHHSTAAKVPIIVAINKIDRPDANPERVKHALAEHNLIPESWGGQTICVEVSAKQQLGLDSLLEMILLQAEVMELKADHRRPARGTVVEARLDRGRGPIATVLVQSGTLRVGDAFVVGAFSGRVRALVADTGAKTSEAGPSMPVEVIGLPGVPAAGDQFVVVKDERVAREIAELRQQKQRAAELAAGAGRVTLEDLYARIKAGGVKELALVLKADVQGSVEALSEAVQKLSTEAVKLRIIHSAVGGITESDVLLASASGAIVIGFNIRPEPKAATLAEREGIDIRLYAVIYDAIADIKAAMEGLLEPTLKERVLGRAEVRQVFTIPKAGVIAGSYVLDGTISRSSAGARIVRDNVVVFEGKLGSLRRFKDDVRDVQQGYECGIGVENFSDLKLGDVVEVYTFDEVATKL